AFERLSRERGQSQLFIETPYRNDVLLSEFLKVMSDTTMLCIATDITLPSESISTKSVAEWKAIRMELHKRPSIFIIQA
ncbi:MAG TPA: hypothetical protein VKN36_12295, partial [Eudoraea sp.]|nr:hypothetical protein [Eudoraea sp.]